MPLRPEAAHAVLTDTRRSPHARLRPVLMNSVTMEDGYINSFYRTAGIENRWTNLKRHEMYCIGHLIQAAIAHHRATGSYSLLSIARHLPDQLRRSGGTISSGE